jgi:predicted ester cyclase
MKLFHRDMVLQTPAFGTTARGLAQNERALTRFFRSFPDYHVDLHGHASDGDTLICWGTARMTMIGDRFGVVPNGRRTELPVFIQFTFTDGLIASERFFFDLSALCAQSGVSTDAVRRHVFGQTVGPNPAQEEPAATRPPDAAPAYPASRAIKGDDT